jgi:hypothetical protein
MLEGPDSTTSKNKKTFEGELEEQSLADSPFQR